ncbi:DUF433 domain-containing protein [Calothrix rhizosoleniae]|uniref:DUF433 domain-containing protein n=1 Tax=Calothrix rhizosoleniae TaxID=888997 RepID=UPI000B49FE95|nr:hypothetical protein [Calothrix rhizosoleniae]
MLQTLFELVLPRFNELVMKIQQIIERQGIVHSDPEIMSGIPVFIGTRVPLQTFKDTSPRIYPWKGKKYFPYSSPSIYRWGN